MKNINEKIVWLWKNLENILIILFFLTFSLNIRKVFLTPYSFLNGGLNEYATISLNWADVLMIAVILIYAIKYVYSQCRILNKHKQQNKECNNKSILSIFTVTPVSHETFFLLLFISWTGLSILWSQYQPIAVYRFLTIVEIALFILVAARFIKKPKWFKLTIFAVLINGLFQSVLGIAQFIHNGSLGIRELGESIVGPNIEGVAKIIIVGEKHIRAYGTFPHPNIMAGFLIVLSFLILNELLSRSKIVKNDIAIAQKHMSEHKAIYCSIKNQFYQNIVSHETILGFLSVQFLCVSGLIIALGVVLTFSRAAFLGFLIGLIVYLFWTINLSVFFHKARRMNVKLVLVGISIIFSLIIAALLLSRYTSFFSSQSLGERNQYNIVSHETILYHPVKGVGIGQFVINEYYRYPNLESWQYQPVHNIYLLIFGELGVVGFIIFLLFLFSIFQNIHENGKRYNLTYILFYCILLSFLFIFFFDHYFWDIKIGILVFVLPFLILASKKNRFDKFL